MKAQLALVQTQMVTVREIFLPYMLTGGGDNETLYTRLAKSDFRALAPGRDGGQ